MEMCTADIYITHDYIYPEDIEIVYKESHIKNIILVDPLYSAVEKWKVRDHILSSVAERYSGVVSNDERNVFWTDFLKFGKNISDFTKVKSGGILFSAFTSGSMGKPKEVLHTSETLLGVIRQLSIFPSHQKGKDTWLLTILPPTLVAVVVAMMLYPLADGKHLILDPFCRMEDLDIEMMHYEPDCWGLIPIFFDVLLDSNRIPDDYDMGYFKLFGFGAEPMTTKFVQKVQYFLDLHNCRAPFSSGYGQSEGGSDFTVCIGREMIASGSAGIPLPDTVISIFEAGTDHELTYGTVGEICKSGPGIMIGYSDERKTEETLLRHKDGALWLHTGDYGYMTPEGLLFVLGRKGIRRYSGKLFIRL